MKKLIVTIFASITFMEEKIFRIFSPPFQLISLHIYLATYVTSQFTRAGPPLPLPPATSLFFFPLSFWRDSTAVSSISLIFTCQLSDVQLKPHIAFFISSIPLLISRSLICMFFRTFISLPHTFNLFSNISKGGNTVVFHSTFCVISRSVFIFIFSPHYVPPPHPPPLPDFFVWLEISN